MYAKYTVHFDDRFGIKFARIIGPTGICFNFNLVYAQDLLNLEFLPNTFNYTKSITLSPMIQKYQIFSRDSGKKFPLSITDYRSGLFSIVHQAQPDEPFDSNHHEKFVAQGFDYLIHSPYEMISKASTLHQSIVNHSMIIYLSPQKTIIDEALQGYPPERFETDVEKK
jgi:hypothetical protein